MDSTIRSLARQSDQAMILKAKLRSGHFQEWQVVALDKLGHPLFGDGTRKVDWTNLPSRQALIESIPELLVKQFSISCAEHVLPIWIKTFPDDQRPAEAIQAAKDFLDGKITLVLLIEKERATWDARCAARTHAAVGAADAAWAAWLAVMASAGPRAPRSAPARVEAIENVRATRIAAHAAEVARTAAACYAEYAEYEWQIQELTKMILEC